MFCGGSPASRFSHLLSHSPAGGLRRGLFPNHQPGTKSATSDRNIENNPSKSRVFLMSLAFFFLLLLSSYSYLLFFFFLFSSSTLRGWYLGTSLGRLGQGAKSVVVCDERTTGGAMESPGAWSLEPGACRFPAPGCLLPGLLSLPCFLPPSASHAGLCSLGLRCVQCWLGALGTLAPQQVSSRGAIPQTEATASCESRTFGADLLDPKFGFAIPHSAFLTPVCLIWPGRWDWLWGCLHG